MTKIRRKSYRELEQIVKGAANHRRIQILNLLAVEPELSVADISERLNINYKTSSEHIRRLAIAGFVLKRSAGLTVQHKLTPQAQTILKFLKTLE